MVTDPLEVWQGYQDAARKSGTFVAATVCAIEPESDGASILTDTGERQSFDYAVLAAGVWSRDIVRHLGLKVLLETERGYNTTYADPDLRLPMSLYFTEHGFVASPLVNALRVGGAVELAQPDAAQDAALCAGSAGGRRRGMDGLPALNAGFAAGDIPAPGK
jgi:D-amino-acid dehydrogenase